MEDWRYDGSGLPNLPGIARQLPNPTFGIVAVLSHYIELLSYHHRSIIRLLVIVPLLVLMLSILMRIVSPIYQASAIVSMSPTKVELAYTDAWAKQNFASPAETSIQTLIEYMNSTPVMEIALDEILERTEGSLQSRRSNVVVAILGGTMDVLSETLWRIYFTLDRGMFVVPSPRELMLFQLRKGTKIEAMTGTFLLNINVSYEQPKIAAIAANALANAYVERASAIVANKADLLKASLEAEADQLLQELAKLDGQRPQILQTRGPDGVAAFERQIERVEEDLRTTRARVLSVDLEIGNLSNEIQVIEPAGVPVYPTSPRMLIYFLAAIVGSLFIACIILVASDLVGEKIVTSFDLRRMTKSHYLGSFVEPLKFRNNSLIKRFITMDREKMEFARLSRNSSMKGVLDASVIYFVGFLSNKESEIAVSRLHASLSGVKDNPDSGSDVNPDSCGAGDSIRNIDAFSIPEMAVLPAFTQGFHWGIIPENDRGFIVFCIPAGVASHEDIEQLLNSSSCISNLKVLFFLVNVQ